MKSVAAFFLPLLLLLASPAGAQPGPPSSPNPYASFSPPMAVIVVALVAALFFIVFFSIYVRQYSASSATFGRNPGAFSFHWPAASRGLDASVIDSFPTFPYSEVKDRRIGKSSDLECAVCLSEFSGDETLRLLPSCDHVFHPECIDAWLASHVTCPVCRADLSPPPPPEAAAAADDPLPESTPVPGDVFVQVVDDNDRLPLPAAAKRSWSIRMPKVGAVGKFRSHSTGHSPGEDLERFTLRLPDLVRKEVLDRASLNRTGSLAAAVPRSSSRARSYKKVERDGRFSDRWGFLTRGASTRSAKAAGDGGSGKSPAIAKMPSLKCLEPKTAEDETGLVAQDSASHPV